MKNLPGADVHDRWPVNNFLDVFSPIRDKFRFFPREMGVFEAALYTNIYNTLREWSEN